MESPNDQDWVRLGWIFLDPKIGVVRPPNLPELRRAASHALDLSNEFPDQADPPPTNWLPTDCRWTPNEAPGTRVLPYLSRTEAEEAPRARECLPAVLHAAVSANATSLSSGEPCMELPKGCLEMPAPRVLLLLLPARADYGGRERAEQAAESWRCAGTMVAPYTSFTSQSAWARLAEALREPR